MNTLTAQPLILASGHSLLNRAKIIIRVILSRPYPTVISINSLSSNRNEALQKWAQHSADRAVPYRTFGGARFCNKFCCDEKKGALNIGMHNRITTVIYVYVYVCSGFVSRQYPPYTEHTCLDATPSCYVCARV
jgi:hypothetical protein